MKERKTIVVFILFLLLAVLIGCQDPADELNGDEVIEETDDIDQDANDEYEDNGTDEELAGDVEEDLMETNGEIDDVTPEEEEPKQEAMYSVNQSNWAIEPITDEANKEVVLLTIDDAPDGHALEMAHTLKELDAPAIFFVNGHFIQTEEKQQILNDIYEMGFSIGNHTYNHPNLGEISEEEQRKEIVELNDLIEEVIGERPEFFRAPFGVNPDFTKEVVEEEGMVLMNWTYGYDWEPDYLEAEALADIMVNTEFLRDGANLLMHDREWTKDALEDIVTGLREQGYEMVNPDLIQKIGE